MKNTAARARFDAFNAACKALDTKLAEIVASVAQRYTMDPTQKLDVIRAITERSYRSDLALAVRELTEIGMSHAENSTSRDAMLAAAKAYEIAVKTIEAVEAR